MKQDSFGATWKPTDTGPVQSPHELIHVAGTGLELPGSLHVILPRCKGDGHQAGGTVSWLNALISTPLILSS